jgi:hypothetical protein
MLWKLACCVRLTALSGTTISRYIQVRYGQGDCMNTEIDSYAVLCKCNKSRESSIAWSCCSS